MFGLVTVGLWQCCITTFEQQCHLTSSHLLFHLYIIIFNIVSLLFQEMQFFSFPALACDSWQKMSGRRKKIQVYHPQNSSWQYPDLKKKKVRAVMTVFKMKVQFLQNERLSNMVEMGQRRKCKFVIHYIYIYMYDECIFCCTIRCTCVNMIFLLLKWFRYPWSWVYIWMKINE